MGTAFGIGNIRRATDNTSPSTPRHVPRLTQPGRVLALDTHPTVRNDDTHIVLFTQHWVRTEFQSLVVVFYPFATNPMTEFLPEFPDTIVPMRSQAIPLIGQPVPSQVHQQRASERP